MSDLPTDPALHTQISGRARGYADIFRLPLAHRTWRGQAGDFQGSGVGSSLDFQDHRNYIPGDDPRHINWQAFARTGNYSMKLYREEVRPLVDLIFDVSDSMFFDETKRQRSLELFYFTVHGVLKSGASLMTCIVKGDTWRRLNEDAIHSHAWAREAADFPDTDASALPNLRALPLRGQALRIFISDLLFTGSPDPSLASLSRARGHGIIFSPYLQSEANPDWEGNLEFIEAEARTRHQHRVERQILKRYLQAYQRHFDLWKTLSRKYDILLARVPADLDFQKSLQFEAVNTGALEIWA